MTDAIELMQLKTVNLLNSIENRNNFIFINPIFLFRYVPD